MIYMLKNWLEEREAQIQSQAESIQKITYQVRQLTENQNYIPQGGLSDDIEDSFEYQAFHYDTLAGEEAV